MHILLLADDLLFASQITAAVAQAGGSCQQMRVDEFIAHATEHGDAHWDMVLVDLTATAARDRIADCLRLGRDTTPGAVQVIAFGPHMQTAALETARAAGCDRVMTRGQLHRELPRLFTTR